MEVAKSTFFPNQPTSHSKRQVNVNPHYLAQAQDLTVKINFKCPFFVCAKEEKTSLILRKEGQGNPLGPPLRTILHYASKKP